MGLRSRPLRRTAASRPPLSQGTRPPVSAQAEGGLPIHTPEPGSPAPTAILTPLPALLPARAWGEDRTARTLPRR